MVQYKINYSTLSKEEVAQEIRDENDPLKQLAHICVLDDVELAKKWVAKYQFSAKSFTNHVLYNLQYFSTNVFKYGIEPEKALENFGDCINLFNLFSSLAKNNQFNWKSYEFYQYVKTTDIFHLMHVSTEEIDDCLTNQTLSEIMGRKFTLSQEMSVFTVTLPLNQTPPIRESDNNNAADSIVLVDMEDSSPSHKLIGEFDIKDI